MKHLTVKTLSSGETIALYQGRLLFKWASALKAAFPLREIAEKGWTITYE